jgi:hypothetical protein
MLERIRRELPKLARAVLGAPEPARRSTRRPARRTRPATRPARRQTDSAKRREPWSGYDDHTVEEIVNRLSDADDARAQAVRDYERAHKSRAGVLEAAERELTTA